MVASSIDTLNIKGIKNMKFIKFTMMNASNTCATEGCNTHPFDGGGLYCYYCRVKMGMPV